MANGNTTHGLSHTPIHNSWSMAKNRCLNPKNERYADYGGRGIKICDRWHSFENFLADMGPTWKPGLTIERKNVNGDYCAENCRWATKIEQARNRRNTRLFSLNGKAQTLAEWAVELGISKGTLMARVYRGKLQGDDVFTKPVQRHPVEQAA